MATVVKDTNKVQHLKKGSILSETSFFTVREVKVNGTVVVTDEHKNEITIGSPYVEKVLVSADYFETEETKTMTELADLFINSARIAMTVAFYKKDKAKGVRVYKAEKQAKIDEIQNARVSEVPNLLNDLIENPISKVIPGEFRVMKGRHYGNMNDLGRIEFKDMEDTSSIVKQVDPRTIQYLIVNGVKYNLK